MNKIEYCVQFRVKGDPHSCWVPIPKTIGWSFRQCRCYCTLFFFNIKYDHRVAIRGIGDWCECLGGGK